MATIHWQSMTPRPITLFVALLLFSPPPIALARTPAGVSAVAKSYAVVSMMDKRLSLVTRKGSTGKRLDNYERRIETMQDDTVSNQVLRSMENAIRQVAPAVNVELLEMKMSVSHGGERASSDEMFDAARRTLKEAGLNRSWDFIVLVGPRREFGERHMMAPDLEGLGFYVGPGSWSGRAPLGVDGDLVRSNRFISPFVSSQIWLLDAKSFEVLATQPVYGYCLYASAKGDAINPWNFFDGATMLKMLTLVVQHDVGEGTKVVVRKSLGMPSVPARQHVEYCTHRYE